MSPTPLRIALISEHASPLADAGGVDAGGQNVYVDHVARGLAARGHQVDVYTRRDDARAATTTAVARGYRVRLVDAGPPRFVPKEELLPHMAAFARELQHLWREHGGHDLVHANFFMSGLAGLSLRQAFGAPLVVTFHALGLVRREHQREADRFPPERIDIERALVQRADRLIASCPQDEADLMRLYGASPERITSVPCGVDIRALRPVDRAAARARLGLDPDAFLVLQLGRLVPRKGIATVVEAMAMLHTLQRADGAGNRPTRRAQLVVVGGESDTPDERLTPEIGRLRALARSLGVADRVHFTGRRQRGELRDWYGAADVFVTTPWYEPFGITPLEAMACGTPVIGSAVGGVRYTVQDGVTGFLVPPQDPAALALRLAQLRDSPALAQALGRAGVQRVRTHFTWDQVADRLQRVYQRQLQPARPAAARASGVAAMAGGLAGAA